MLIKCISKKKKTIVALTFSTSEWKDLAACIIASYSFKVGEQGGETAM